MGNDMYIGQFLDDRYEILEKIGSGGMADVYKARCHRLNRLVAIKILKSDLAQDPDFRRRFQAESQAVAMLSHSNIVSVYDVNMSDNLEYIVMELIEGITLKQYINRKGVLNWKEALHFSSQTAKALSHAHSRGIIHRDIKPHNIMILKDGSVKVTDFGIAQLLSSQQNTLTQQALGSVHYISPEQAKGAHVDTRSDIYSLGVVMYEMLTSRLPFEGDSAVSVAIQHISSIPLMPRDINPDIPVGLEQITMKAMEPNLDLRYASTEEMLKDLEEFRKNPDIVFKYGPDVPSVQNQSFDDLDSTRVINSEEVAVTPAINKVHKPVKVPKPKTPTKAEHAKNRRRAGRTSILIGIFCIALVIILLLVFMWKYLLKDMIDPEEEFIMIPQFTGSYLDTVNENQEYKQYFKFEVKFEQTDEYPEGYIMYQSPDANNELAVRQDGINVTLTVAQSKDIVLMPSLANKDYREAITEVEALDVGVEIIPEGIHDEAVTENYVIDQYPAAGEPLIENSTVYITYSLGREIDTVPVPEVTGLTESQAISRLKSYDFVPEVEYVESEEPKGKVIFQSYPAGEDLPVKTVVVIQVSEGPAEVDPPIVDDPYNPNDPFNPGGTITPGITTPGTEGGTVDPTIPDWFSQLF